MYKKFKQKLDPKQWVKAVKSAGMRELILTCKRHDGFCLWDSKFTKHSVGGNATFLLNIPPTRDGLLHENDVKRLAELEYIIDTFQTNLM